MRSIWSIEHVDFLEELMRQNADLTAGAMAVQMSRHFKQRVTSAHVNALLQRMRKPSDVFYRNLPYRRRGARFAG